MQTKSVSQITLNNWLLDAGLFISAVVTAITGIYLWLFPSGGFQGGRNLMQGFTLAFNRYFWISLHTWSGVAMIIIAAVHLIIHWKWVVGTIKRIYREVTGRCECMNARGHFNAAIDAVVVLSFLVAAVSGVYFLIFGSGHGWRAIDPMFLFSRSIWDSIHTWSSFVMIAAAAIHFAIHWQWVVKVTQRILSIPAQPAVMPMNQT